MQVKALLVKNLALASKLLLEPFGELYLSVSNNGILYQFKPKVLEKSKMDIIACGLKIGLANLHP
jgi:hypothetical protein